MTNSWRTFSRLAISATDCLVSLRSSAYCAFWSKSVKPRADVNAIDSMRLVTG